MRYLWEAVIKAWEEGIPLDEVRFVHAPLGSAYMELALPFLNQPEIGGSEVEVNTYYRFYSIFKDIFGPEQSEYPALRESLTNLILHMLAENDVRAGMTKEEYYKKLLATDIREGAFDNGASVVFAALNKEERGRLLSGWLRSYRTGSALAIFTDMIHGLVDDSIVYHNQDFPTEILIYTGSEETPELKARMKLLIDMFLDIKYRAEVFYKYHFGIIGMDETMQIDEIAMY